MAATDEFSTSHSLANLTSPCFDQSDIDSFINYPDNPQAYPSPSSISASSSVPGKISVSQPTTQNHAPTPGPAAGPNSSAGFGANGTQSPQLMFAAPSHEYDSYKQQTGLPPGGLANTMAMNTFNNGVNLGMGNQNFAMPSEGSFNNGRHQSEEMIDFASPPMQSYRLRNSTDMDVEEKPSEGMQGYMFSQSVPSKTQFVDPNALGGHEYPRYVSSNQVGRMYPGMHQQQAAMAKAAQQQQQQQELARRQQHQQHQPQPQPHQSQPQLQQSEEADGVKQNKLNRPSDPVVEERISRLLQQMRQNSSSSPEDALQAGKNLPHISRPRKEEDEMDEDERLLASEEGKKLSSKERRQLRNKVSARAFRSRRKEYIGQLEGEVAARTNEANELRIHNRTLAEENARLTDLTRMLLSSQHFSTFLNDISVNGLPAPKGSQPTPIPGHAQPSPSDDAKPSSNPQDVHMQNQQMSLPVIPEYPVEQNSNDMNGGWNTGIDMNFNNAPVFAVLDVPEGPEIDTTVLSGKSSNTVGPLASSGDAKDQVPMIELPPVEEPCAKQTVASRPHVEADESDPSLALYMDQSSPKTSDEKPFEDMFGGVETEKVFARLELVVKDSPDTDKTPTIDAATMLRFERLCASIEAPFQRVLQATSHIE